MRKLILRNFLSPGDIVMLTAAVRDLHLCYPGQFVTDVRTPYAQLWENNPYLTPLTENAPGVETIDCHYPLIQQSNQRPYHFIHAFIMYLNERLDLNIKPTLFKGDIHLSEEEKSWYSQVREMVGDDRPFWLISAGGKFDFTIKWWEVSRFQEVINKLRGQVLFVQVGLAEHHHPPLEGALDLRGKTDLRHLVRLVYHSQGVLCPVTALMHLAAAVATKEGQPVNRPCVVIAGGREPSHWEAYQHHQFIHTIGALPCCETGGCWKSRVVPLGDGDEKDRSDNLCTSVVGKLPKCMDMITSDEVVRRIQLYFTGGIIKYLADTTSEGGQPDETFVWAELSKSRLLTIENATAVAEKVIKNMPEYPPLHRGKGIVICGGGVKYFTNAWVCVNMLRRLGCELPIQLWFLGTRELDEAMAGLMGEFDVQCVDALEVQRRSPCRILKGWELKPYAIVHSSFREVLLLDSDNLPLINPEALFSWPEYHKTGALFWPDYLKLAPDREIWRICGVPYREEPEFETGQILVDKARCWNALLLCMWYNANSDFFYRYVYGDKETFHMAFRKLNQPFAMPSRGIFSLVNTMCQHDFHGNRIFQHRNFDKWTLEGRNKHIEGFLHENECRDFVAQLRSKWDGKIQHRHWTERAKATAKSLTSATFVYNRVGHDSREMTFNSDGTIGRGSGGCERNWDLREQADGPVHLQILSADHLTCELTQDSEGVWRGRWFEHERMPIELRPKTDPDFRSGTTDRAIWEEVYAANLYGLPDALPPDAVIIDVGAHIGAFTCACLARSAQYIYAYEPDTENYRLAQANIARTFQRFQRDRAHNPVCLDNIAIWGGTETTELQLTQRIGPKPPDGLVDHGAWTTLFSGDGALGCRGTGLDTLLQELPYVSLLKLHCEGAEWPILFHSKLLHKVEQVIVQLHDVTQMRVGPRRIVRPEVADELHNLRLDSLAKHMAQWNFSLSGHSQVKSRGGTVHMANNINGTAPLSFVKTEQAGMLNCEEPAPAELRA